MHRKRDRVGVITQRTDEINQNANQRAKYQPALIRDGRADGVSDNKECREHGGAAEQVEQGAAAALGAAAVITHERAESDCGEHRNRCMPGEHPPVQQPSATQKKGEIGLEPANTSPAGEFGAAGEQIVKQQSGVLPE